MASLGSLRPSAQQTVPTDTIVPFHYYDDAKHTNGLCFDLTFRFDDKLDPAKLRSSLDRLLELGDWRKLGARIRRNDLGKLEYHIPQHFDGNSRPGFAFSTADLDTAVDEHPLASRLAQPHALDAAGRPLAFRVPSRGAPGSVEFRVFIRAPHFPECIEDWLGSDSPQLGVRVLRFRDATLVTVSFLHSLTDMMGLHAILDAWAAVLRGDEARVGPFLGFAQDPLAGLAKPDEKTPPVKYVFAEMLLTGWAFVLFALRYFLLVELFWRYREEERIVFLPAKHIQQMRKAALDELRDHEQKPSFVSEGDVLFAWWTRVALRSEKPAPHRTLNMRNTCCCRSLLAELGLVPSAAALVTNAVFGTITLLKVCDVLQRPLAFTASEVRRALMQQRRGDQLRALDAIRRDRLDRKNHPAVFGDANMFMFMMSNWEKAKLFSIDFSPAVVAEGLGAAYRKNKAGFPSCIQGSGGIAVRDMFVAR